VNPITAWKWWRKFAKLEDSIKEEMKMGYDPKVGAAKALRDFVITALAIGGLAIFEHFMVPENLALVLGFLPDTIEKAIIAILSPLLVFGYNWLKERKR
jgi:hypothetical protein